MYAQSETDRKKTEPEDVSIYERSSLRLVQGENMSLLHVEQRGLAGQLRHGVRQDPSGDRGREGGRASATIAYRAYELGQRHKAQHVLQAFGVGQAHLQRRKGGNTQVGPEGEADVASATGACTERRNCSATTRKAPHNGGTSSKGPLRPPAAVGPWPAAPWPPPPPPARQTQPHGLASWRQTHEGEGYWRIAIRTLNSAHC